MSRQYPARPVASAAGVVLNGDQVLLVRRGFAPRKGIWTYPGGAIETGETAREACAREVLEETGLTVEVGAVIEAVDVMESHEGRWRYHYTILDFLCALSPSSGPVQAASDAAEAVWVPVDGLGSYNLTPIALHVLRRALWLRNSDGPMLEGGARTLFGEDEGR